jgi:regulatory protein
VSTDLDLSFERAKALALRLLAHRARSEAQVRARLQRAGFASEAIDAALSRLRELRFLDDAAYAQARAETLLSRGRFGPAAAAARLAGEGVPEAMALAAIRAACGQRDERALARECLAARRLPLSPGAPAKERARAARFLLGRGFSEEAVRDLLSSWEDSSS